MQNVDDKEQDKLKELMNNTIKEIKQMLQSSTILGESVNLGNGCVVFPILKVTVGLITGGGEYSAKKIKNKEYPFAGGSGTGFSAQPIGFLINNNGDVKLCTLKSKDVYAQVLKDLSGAFTDLVKNTTKTKNGVK